MKMTSTQALVVDGVLLLMRVSRVGIEKKMIST